MALRYFSGHNWFNAVLYILGYKVIVNVYMDIYLWSNPMEIRKFGDFSTKYRHIYI